MSACARALELQLRNLCAAAPEAQAPRAHVPQQGGHHAERPTSHEEEELLLTTTRESPCMAMRAQCTQNKYMNEQVIFKNLQNKSLHRSPKIRLDLAKVNLVVDPHDYSHIFQYFKILEYVDIRIIFQKWIWTEIIKESWGVLWVESHN